MIVAPPLTVAVVGDVHFSAAQNPHAATIEIPNTTVLIGIGDWVQNGTNDEYRVAVEWTKGIKRPMHLIRGNHDNGHWRPHAQTVVPGHVAEQWHPENDFGVVEWKPGIWVERREPVIAFPERDPWPGSGQRQERIIKQRDLALHYYVDDIDGVRFIFLDTSNWQLGQRQLAWLRAQTSGHTLPIVLVMHHHVLPVGTSLDETQLHERDVIRQLLIDTPSIIACIHGHAHHDAWFRYGHVDMISVGANCCRTVTVDGGRISAVTGPAGIQPPQPFTPSYIIAQCPEPGSLCWVIDDDKPSYWTPYPGGNFGWYITDGREIEIRWTMRLPTHHSDDEHELRIQLTSVSRTRITAHSPTFSQPRVTDVRPQPTGSVISISLGPLYAGHYDIRLQCSEGWGHAAVTATLAPTCSPN